MRLEKIKLSGFKSFVDSTTISFTSDLVGIVGPNGCGKSNVIDAVRWVLGESSAKHLRGDQMADVIFNGSTTRKPVGQAFVELTFDNSDATITGEFASYRQIALKRQVNREGQSVYFLNGTRCRRKDITDLFLGTGLGPRSYAIIEQGTISRLVEAKPDELRVFLEEAAGISKYKERRRDTENRMRRTRENLERISDLCEEIEKQCKHLKRQASTAERYKVLKAEERQFKAQLLALRWQALNAQDEGQDKSIKALELKVDGSLAVQRELEKTIEQQRDEHNTQRAKLSEVQAEFYAVGSDIAKVEQALQHQKSLKQQQESELERFKTSLKSSQFEFSEGEKKIVASSELVHASERSLIEAKTQESRTSQLLLEAEDAMTQWQKDWDEFTYKVAEPKRKIDVEKTKINQLDRQLMQVSQQLSAGQNEKGRLQQVVSETDVYGLQKEHDVLSARHQKDQEQVIKNQQVILRLQTTQHEENDALATLRAEHSRLNGRLESILVLQQSNRGDSHEKVGQWLAEKGLSKASRLIEEIDVVTGWEKAVEIVLGARLQAVCVDDFNNLLMDDEYPAGELVLFNGVAAHTERNAVTSLASLVTSKIPTVVLLKSVHFAEDIKSAITLMESLAEHESVITKKGDWLHADSVFFKHDDLKDSALVLEKEKQGLTQRLQVVAVDIVKKEQLLVEAREELMILDKRGHEMRQQESAVMNKISQFAIDINERKLKAQQASQRLLQLDENISEAAASQKIDEASLAKSKQALELAIDQSAQLEEQRDELQQQRQIRRELLDAARRATHSSRELMHSLVLKIESQRSAQALTDQNLHIIKDRMSGAIEKIARLQEQLIVSNAPVDDQKQSLEDLLKKRLMLEEGLVKVRSLTEAIDQRIRELETKRHQAEQAVQQARENTSAAKINHQEVRVRKQTLVEQLQESGVELDETLRHISDDANDEQWQKEVDHLAEKINRLGLINLTAIEEYETQSERKQYLDSQLLDLTESLKTLEAAIGKIDKESRLLFKQTFDKVNAGFEKRFPKLFGGGHAYLQQTGEDLLETGVTVMARPPGKRNSSIHLLSGGEKALTAVALVFSIFDLNPSPFCMLDEVDAPLDEANVGRFGELVKEMSQHVQMILITHNKATMEMTNQLAGVTMKEPGVSRLVTVDLEEAAKMVVS
ncbi:MAG: chromosome segregation protein SMC [Cycloclasticus sp. symbiont of Bathymodiolus heckerae]|nr:MAG: chromosome segregation protein SMC [Cycloclasticus sp. symbiont of Bathymodiolus heckerae]